MTPRERYNELKSKASNAGMPVYDPHKRYIELKAKAEPELNMYERQAREDSGLTNFLSGMGGGVNSLIEGAKQAAGADNQAEINSSHLLHLKQVQSQIKDLDYTEAVTRLNLRLTGLEASQKAYTKVQSLSMFDYI